MRIPNDFTVARNSNEDWARALSTFDTPDPHRILSNPLLDQLAPSFAPLAGRTDPGTGPV